eukprot:TRINITY_DN13496_c0_g1_i1.p1 TRINITY_DN13496_c0_g1~~TRINITY_DN13496_c0_g1_i1.p1  ORF type:complete len:253 (-),score=54.91 TRINITY_DN13496_c0_g1_i1:25-690(-)
MDKIKDFGGKIETIADVGSGTGIFTKLLLEEFPSARIIAIEPNGNMRSSAESMLSHYSNFTSSPGNAEQTGLEDHSVDLITAATAAHWFDIEKSRKEFLRILRPGGRLAILTNRAPASYMNWRKSLSKSEHEALNQESLEQLFGGKSFEEIKIPNGQMLDLEGLKGRVASSSYCPSSDDARFSEVMRSVEMLFEMEKDPMTGLFPFIYQCEMFIGPIENSK